MQNNINYSGTIISLTNSESQICAGTVDIITNKINFATSSSSDVIVKNNKFLINNPGTYNISASITIEVGVSIDYLNLHIAKNDQLIATNLNSTDSSPYTLKLSIIENLEKGDVIKLVLDCPDDPPNYTIISAYGPTQIQFTLHKLK